MGDTGAGERRRNLALGFFDASGAGLGGSATEAVDSMAEMMAGNVDSVSSAMSSIMA